MPNRLVRHFPLGEMHPSVFVSNANYERPQSYLKNYARFFKKAHFCRVHERSWQSQPHQDLWFLPRIWPHFVDLVKSMVPAFDFKSKFEAVFKIFEFKGRFWLILTAFTCRAGAVSLAYQMHCISLPPQPSFPQCGCCASTSNCSNAFRLKPLECVSVKRLPPLIYARAVLLLTLPLTSTANWVCFWFSFDCPSECCISVLVWSTKSNCFLRFFALFLQIFAFGHRSDSIYWLLLSIYHFLSGLFSQIDSHRFSTS